MTMMSKRASSDVQRPKVVVIGALTQRMTHALLEAGVPPNRIQRAQTMSQAVDHAYALAAPTQAPVVLSPAASSFDMFKSYADRGEQFQAAVNALAATHQA